MSDPQMSIRLSQNHVQFANKALCSYILGNLLEMRKKEELCDVSLAFRKCPSNEVDSRNIMAAHACVLAATSELFSELFRSSASKRYIQMEEFDKDVLSACLDYMYGQEISMPYERVEALKVAAETLRLTYLTVQCSVALDTIKKNRLEHTGTQDLSSSVHPLVDNNGSVDYAFKLNTSPSPNPNEMDCQSSNTEDPEDDKESSRLLRKYGVGVSECSDESQSEDKFDTQSNCDPSNSNAPSQSHETNDNVESGEMDNAEQARKMHRTKEMRNECKRSAQANEESESATFIRKHKRIKCDHCNRTFAGTDGLNKHKAVVKKNPNFTSRVVYKTIEERQKAKNQTRKRLEKKEYICKDCGITCSGWSKYNVHKRLTHNVSLVCQYCSKVFAWPHSLKIHEKRHEEAKNYTCSHCNFRAVSKTEVEHHEQRKHLNDKYICSFCPAVFKCKLDRKKHELYSHLKDPIKCPHCEYSGTTQNAVDKHVLNKHFPEKRKLWPCRICSKQFTQKGQLDRHLKDVHHEEPTKLGYATVNRDVMRTLESAVEAELINLQPAIETTNSQEPNFIIESQEIPPVDIPADLYFVRDEMGNLYRCDNVGNLSTLLEGDVHPSDEVSTIHDMSANDKMEVLDY